MASNRAAVMGSSAYELERLGALPELPTIRTGTGERAEPEVGTRPNTGTRTRTRAKARPAQRVSRLAIVGYSVAGIMLVMVVLAHIQLAVVSAETVELESQLEALQEESDLLQIAYESAFNQAAVEQYAKEELGMTEELPGQVYYIDIGTGLGDRAEIIEVEESRDYGVLSDLGELFKSLVAYFTFWN